MKNALFDLFRFIYSDFGNLPEDVKEVIYFLSTFLIFAGAAYFIIKLLLGGKD